MKSLRATLPAPGPLLAGCLAVVLSACAGTPSRSTPDADAAFKTWSDGFIQEALAFYPDFAILSGEYRHAWTMVVPDARRRALEVEFVDRQLQALAAHDARSLSPGLRADRAIIENQLKSTRWSNQVMRDWAWNPSNYNVADPFSLLLDTEYAPLEERLRTILRRLAFVPDYYAAAQASVAAPTREHTRLAIEQNRGALSVFGPELEAKVAASALSREDKALFGARLAAARSAIEGYVAFLERLEAGLTDASARSFRLGRELYEPKFAFDIQAGMSAEALYRRALAEKQRLHAHMSGIATQLWPKYFPGTTPPADEVEKIGTLIRKLSERHVAPGEFFDEVQRQIGTLSAFVREHKLLDQDPTKPLIVRRTPEYKRGIALASIDAPGPFNPGAATYYNVEPLETLPAERSESLLREYNHWMLQILNIHEAIPGHYAQLVHANRSPSLIKSLFGNGAMIEGWAVYSERMMLENGWGENEPEMWLIYDKWFLRSVCNTILDYSVHVLGMSREDALQLLTREAFQTQAEADGKWRRVSLTQVQLTSYFAGASAIYDFREEQKRRLGAQFELEAFHNRFLSYGSAPVAVIRELMTGSE